MSTSKTVREFDMELSIIQISTASRISVLSYKMTINKLSIIDGLRCCDYMVALTSVTLFTASKLLRFENLTKMGVPGKIRHF